MKSIGKKIGILLAAVLTNVVVFASIIVIIYLFLLGVTQLFNTGLPRALQIFISILAVLVFVAVQLLHRVCAVLIFGKIDEVLSGVSKKHGKRIGFCITMSVIVTLISLSVWMMVGGMIS